MLSILFESGYHQMGSFVMNVTGHLVEREGP